MTNREKFAEQILDIACGGSEIAVDKTTLELTSCYKLACKNCLFSFGNGDCRGARKNGQTVNMLNHQLTGQKLQLIHRYWQRIVVFTRGLKGILRNMRMEEFTLGIMEQHHGVVRCVQYAN